MKFRFSSLNIGLQVASLVVVAAAALAAVGVFQWEGRLRRDAALAEASLDRALFDDVTRLEVGLLQLRRAEKNFLMRLDQKSRDEHAEHRRAIEPVLGRLAEATKTGARAALERTVQEVARDVAVYFTAFDRLVATRIDLGTTPDAGFEGALRRAVHDVEKVLGDVEDAEARILLLQLRRHEKDFMLRRDAKYVAAFDKVSGQLGARLERIPSLPEGVGRQLAVYRSGFAAWVAAQRAVAEAEAAMQTVHRGMEPEVAALANEAEALRGVAEAEASAVSVAVEQRTTWGFGVALAVLIGLSLLVGRAITRPIRGMTDAMGRLAAGDLDVIVPGRDAENEIGRMAEAVEIFRDNARERATLEEARRGEAARMAAERRAAVDTLVDRFESRIGGVVSTVSAAATELEAAAGTLSASSEEVSAQSMAVAAAAEQATSNVQNVAAATEELSATVGEVGRQVARSAEVAAEALIQAEETTSQVSGLAEAADEIGTIVQLISEIAAQTNLLALNATIEAARAGDAGRGFAVVAQEVKGLAEQTARATQQIGIQVATIQGSTHRAAEAIGVIARTIERMNGIAGSIAAAVEEQGAATAEISRNLQQAANGTGDVSANIGGVSTAATSTSAVSTQVLASASGLAKEAEMLRGAVSTFLHEVREG